MAVTAGHRIQRRKAQTRVELETTMATAATGMVSLTPSTGARQTASNSPPAKPPTA